MLDVIVGYGIATTTIVWYGVWAGIVGCTIGIPFFMLWAIPVMKDFFTFD